MARSKKFYLGERSNPQLQTYWIKYGQLTKAESKKKENCMYGSITVHSFDTEIEYNKKISELQVSGARVT